MTKNDAIVATFSDHTQAEGAVRKLAQGGLDIKHFSIIGKGYHKDEQILGFYMPSAMVWTKIAEILCRTR